MRPILLFLSIGILLLSSSCHSAHIADRIYYNAKIWTGDSANPEVTAIAIKDSLILYVGNAYQPFARARNSSTCRVR